MADVQRSPFGERVYRHRRKLSLTQLDVSVRTGDVALKVPEAAPITERSIAALERRTDDRARWIAPRPTTVRTLSRVFGLAPGSPSFEDFFEAAEVTASAAREPAAPEQPLRQFIAAGREPHLNRLCREVYSAVARSPGVVFIRADPGTGKTWLIEEACRDAVERHPGLVTLWGSCAGPVTPSESHQPFRQMLHLMVGDLGMASPEQRISAINDARLVDRSSVAVRALVADGRGLISRVLADEALWNDRLAGVLDTESRRVVEQALGSAPDADGATSGREQFVRVLARYAESGPVILAFDDLHWADTATIASLTHLVQRLHQLRLPVLVVGSFRPGDLEPTPSGDRHPLHTLIQTASRTFLDPIVDLSTAVGGEAGRSFVDDMLRCSFPEFPRDLADELVARTGGLPLFVAGLLRLYEQGGTISGIPTEIETLFFQQVDQLPPELQDTLAAASVQGNAFAAEVLMHVRGHDQQSLIAMVDAQLVRRYRLLVPGGRSTVAGQVVHEYQFSHALFRDYVYTRMTELERTHYHALTADALIALCGEQDHDATDAIAVHLDRAALRDRAAVAHHHAGNHAMIRREFDRAVQHFERVDELGIRHSDPATYLQAHIGLGNCYRGMSEPRKARAILDDALEIADRRGLSIVQGNVLESLAMLDFDAGNMQSGVERLVSVIDIWTEVDHHEAGRAMANIGFLLYGLGRYEEAISFAQRGSEMATRLDDYRMWLDAEIAVANCWLDLGLYEDAVSTYRRCIDVCEDIGAAHRQRICRLNIALAGIEMEQWDVAGETVDLVVDADTDIALSLVGVIEFTLGVIAEGRGDLADAHGRYETSREIRETTGQDALLIDSLAGILRVAIADGDRERVGILHEDIRSRIDQRGLDGIEHVGRLFVTLVEASSALGNEQMVREHIQRALDFLNERASRLSDPAHRESYLSNVPAHRRINELATSFELVRG